MAETALETMKAKARAAMATGMTGYVTYLPELRAILAELTDRVPVGVTVEFDQYHTDVTIKVGFSLDPEPRETIDLSGEGFSVPLKEEDDDRTS